MSFQGTYCSGLFRRAIQGLKNPTGGDDTAWIQDMLDRGFVLDGCIFKVSQTLHQKPRCGWMDRCYVESTAEDVILYIEGGPEEWAYSGGLIPGTDNFFKNMNSEWSVGGLGIAGTQG